MRYAVIQEPSAALLAASVQGGNAAVHKGYHLLTPRPNQVQSFEGIPLYSSETIRNWQQSDMDSLEFFVACIQYADYHQIDDNHVRSGAWLAAQNKVTVIAMAKTGQLTVAQVMEFDSYVFKSVQALSSGDFLSCMRLATEAKQQTSNQMYRNLIDQLTAPVLAYLDGFYQIN